MLAQIPFRSQVCGDFHSAGTSSVLTFCLPLTTAILLMWDPIHSFIQRNYFMSSMYNYYARLWWGVIGRVYRGQSATDLSLKGIYIGMRELRCIKRTSLPERRQSAESAMQREVTPYFLMLRLGLSKIHFWFSSCSVSLCQ